MQSLAALLLALPLATAPRPAEVLLTFDDGPDLAFSPRIAELIEEYGGRAVFFVNGARLSGPGPDALARRALLRVLHEHGHLVGNHTFDHKNLCLRGTDVARQIDDNERLVEALIGVRPTLFRAPYGTICESLDRALAARPHLVSLGWTIDAQEWQNGADAGEAIIEELKKLPAGARAVVLLHDAHRATLPTLTKVLEWLGTQDRVQLLDAREVLLPFAESAPPDVRKAVIAWLDVAARAARAWIEGLPSAPGLG